MTPKKIASYLEKQKQYLKQVATKSFGLISKEFLLSMRKFGYNSTFKALAEFIDNSIQAMATEINVVVKTVPGIKRNAKPFVGEIALIDNGYGMEPDMMRAALVWGGTHRYNDRQGIGRYGVGLPAAAGSISPQYNLYSKLDGDDWYCIYYDITETMKSKTPINEMKIGKAVKTTLPGWLANIEVVKKMKHGTIIWLKNPDALSQGYTHPQGFLNNFSKEVSTTYRNYLERAKISIVEYKKRDDVYGEPIEIEPVDPLFLREDCKYYSVAENDYLAEHRTPLNIPVKGVDGKKYNVRVRFSLRHPGFARHRAPNQMRVHQGRMSLLRKWNAHIILTRSGRQMNLLRSTHYPTAANTGIQNNDRFWAVEVDFPAALDEMFNVPSNKQTAYLSDSIWQLLENHGVPTTVMEMKNTWKEMNATFTNAVGQTQEEAPYVESEEILNEAEKFETVDTLPEEVKEEVEKEKEEKKKELIKEGMKEEEAEKQAEDSTGIRYKFSEESLPGAPFYRVINLGGLVEIRINTNSKFYTELYGHEKTTPRQRHALNLLIGSMAATEAKSGKNGKRWYQRARGQWTERMNTFLDMLNDVDFPGSEFDNVEFENPFGTPVEEGVEG